MALVSLAAAAFGVGVSYGRLYAAHLALLCMLGALAWRAFREKQGLVIPRTATNLHLLFPLMLLWYVLGVLWSHDRWETVKYAGYIAYGCAIVGAAVFYATDRIRLRRLHRVLAAVFAIEVIVALLEAFTPFRYPISPQSTLAPLFGRAMLLQPSHFDPATLAVIRTYPTGFEWNPNKLAVVMVIILPFALVARRWWLKLVTTAAIATVIVMTSSRAGFLAAGVVVLLWTVWISRYRVQTAIVAVLMAGLIAFGGLDNGKMMAWMPVPALREVFNVGPAIGRLFKHEARVNDSVTIRRKYFDNGISALLSSGGIGVGGGCAGNEEYQRDALMPGSNRASLHNFWLELLTEGGILFFFAFMLWYATLIRNLPRVHRRSDRDDLRRWGAAAALSLIGLVPAAVSASSVIYLGPMWLLFGFSIATINLYYQEPPPPTLVGVRPA